MTADIIGELTGFDFALVALFVCLLIAALAWCAAEAMEELADTAHADCLAEEEAALAARRAERERQP
jgi:hypothetical protein